MRRASVNRNACPPDPPPLVIDLASFGLLGFLFLVAALAPPETRAHGTLPLHIAIAALIYGTGRWIVQRLRPGPLRISLHCVALLLLYSFLFGTSTSLQSSLVTEPADELLIAADRAVFGSEASVWMQRFVTPLLTEWMMFAYVVYLPMVPAVCFLCWKSSRERAVYEYLAAFALVNVVCYLGFIVFPVETPLYHHPEKYLTPLEGGVFTWCGEWVRANLQQKGGGLPSPHCAVATVMLAMVRRHWRKAFPFVLPVVLTLYVSTVYCRYHYLYDGLTGILCGLVVLRWSPLLVALVERIHRDGRVRGLLAIAHPHQCETAKEETQ